MREIKAGKNEDGMKLKKLCFKYFDNAPQSFTYKMLRKKNITLNGKKADGEEVLKSGDIIKLFLADETIDKFHKKGAESDTESKESSARPQTRSFKLDGSIIFEDNDILIINKPAGILSQRADKTDYSVNEAVIDYLLEKKAVTRESLELFRPSVCNRLDRNTSGLISAGKTLKGSRYLSGLFRDRTGNIKKIYLVLVHGKAELSNIFTLYLSKDEKENMVSINKHPEEGSDKIVTEFHTKRYLQDSDVTLLSCVLHTGKSHQIRAVLKYLGYPVVGDMKYGDNMKDRNLKPRPKRQLLHAYKLKLLKPDGSTEKEFTAGIPKDMMTYLEK